MIWIYTSQIRYWKLFFAAVFWFLLLGFCKELRLLGKNWKPGPFGGKNPRSSWGVVKKHATACMGRSGVSVGCMQRPCRCTCGNLLFHFVLSLQWMSLSFAKCLFSNIYHCFFWHPIFSVLCSSNVFSANNCTEYKQFEKLILLS